MKIVVVAGGTGGHIFPALATMKKIKELAPSTSILWITTLKSNEADLAQEYSLNWLSLAVEGFQRKVSLQPLRAFVKFVFAFIKMFFMITPKKCDAVIAYGGYVCGPVVMAAKFRGVPIYLHEQNSVPGAVNRFFASSAQRIFLGMPLAEGWHLAQEDRVVGTPVRTIDTAAIGCYEFDNSINTTVKTVFICGGSQGAVSMNNVLYDAVDWMVSKGLQVVWQTGKPGLDAVVEKYTDEPLVIALASINSMYPYYNLATVVIGRAGASTISEAALFAKPSLFIPLPWSAENHQWFNAGFAEDAGWAVRVKQDDKSSETIISCVDEMLFTQTKRYDTMEEMAQKSTVHTATDIVANEVIHHDK